MTVYHQDGHIRVEEHLAGDRGVEHPGKKRTAVGAQRYHVDFLITHELLDGQEQIAIGQDRMRDVCLWVLLAEVFPYTTEPNLVPFVSTGRDIEQVDVERIAFD